MGNHLSYPYDPYWAYEMDPSYYGYDPDYMWRLRNRGLFASRYYYPYPYTTAPIMYSSYYDYYPSSLYYPQYQTMPYYGGLPLYQQQYYPRAYL
ncbi:hypothetical protein VTP01DRAFT_6362 [Rhizomucor pusillus]|uniref:uncharacterized protein n=1 Tax=Rhizomucor pusillus TaxID=4840 RepID=UPI0037442F78